MSITDFDAFVARAITERKERAADFRERLLLRQRVRRGTPPTFGLDFEGGTEPTFRSGRYMDAA